MSKAIENHKLPWNMVNSTNADGWMPNSTFAQFYNDLQNHNSNSARQKDNDSEELRESGELNMDMEEWLPNHVLNGINKLLEEQENKENILPQQMLVNQEQQENVGDDQDFFELELGGDETGSNYGEDFNLMSGG